MAPPKQSLWPFPICVDCNLPRKSSGFKETESCKELAVKLANARKEQMATGSKVRASIASNDVRGRECAPWLAPDK